MTSLNVEGSSRIHSVLRCFSRLSSKCAESHSHVTQLFQTQTQDHYRPPPHPIGAMESRHTNDPCETKENIETPREHTIRYVFHLVIPNKSRDCVLGEVLPNAVLRLPRTKLPVGFDGSEPNKEDEVETWIEEQLGINGYIADALWNGKNKRIDAGDDVEVHEILLLDTLEKEPAVGKPFEWIRRDIAYDSEWMPTNRDGEDDHVKMRVDSVFQEINGEEPTDDEAWTTIGWIEKVRSWTNDVLRGRNLVMEGKIRQRHRTGHSLVLSCKAKKRSKEGAQWKESSEVVFIKASSPSIREAQRTATIGGVVGNIVPEVMAIREKEGIMIQRNGGMVTDGPVDQEALINTVVKMQLLSMNHISELEAGGLKVLDSEWLELNIESILNHKLLDDHYYSGPDGEIDETEKRMVDDLRSKVGVIQKGCRKITRLGLPNTIVHGDLHLENVGSPLKEGNVYRMYDWARSFIGNPLHDFDFLYPPYSPCPRNSIDYEAGVRQVCKHWMPNATLEEMKSIFGLIGMMSEFICIYDLTQQYDASEDSGCRGGFILGEFSEQLEYVKVIEDVEVRES